MCEREGFHFIPMFSDIRAVGGSQSFLQMAVQKAVSSGHCQVSF